MDLIKRPKKVQRAEKGYLDEKKYQDYAESQFKTIYDKTDEIIKAIGEGGGEGTNITQIANLFFPIGRGFLDFTNTDYSNWLGLTWERELVGMFPVGYDANDTDFNEIGKTGGEKTHQLTVNEMPNHQGHIDKYRGNATGKYINTSNIFGSYGTSGRGWDDYSGEYYPAYFSEGLDEPHNNLPQYQVVAYWKRVA